LLQQQYLALAKDHEEVSNRLKAYEDRIIELSGLLEKRTLMVDEQARRIIEYENWVKRLRSRG
jgi:hypothetical protein